ncbi:MAG TPA: response regulator transcription factor [Vicinamibacterales bacterium]|nr:response regulator transcription factor [Vicinamibacterales bacterium]
MIPAESRVVIIEPERELLDAICFHFQVNGYECIGLTTADGAARRLSEQPVALVVMDFGVVGRPAHSLPDRFAKVLPHGTRILLMTNRKDDPDVLAALERYADDFVTKPVNVPELLARGRALIRRTSFDSRRRPLIARHGDLTVDPARRRVDVAGVDVKMTDQEFRFLYTLVSRPGVVFTRRDLLDTVWSGDTHVTARCVDALVKRARRKLEAVSPGPVPLQTVRGVGYKYSDACTFVIPLHDDNTPPSSYRA